MTYAWLSQGRDAAQMNDLDRSLMGTAVTMEDINRRNYEQMMSNELFSKQLQGPKPVPLPHRRRKQPSSE